MEKYYYVEYSICDEYGLNGMAIMTEPYYRKFMLNLLKACDYIDNGIEFYFHLGYEEMNYFSGKMLFESFNTKEISECSAKNIITTFDFNDMIADNFWYKGIFINQFIEGFVAEIEEEE